MELRHAKYVIALSEELNFTAAAKRCGVSQPSLSIALLRLESELGGALFVRKPKVQLTQLGWRVLPDLHRMTHAADALARTAAT